MKEEVESAAFWKEQAKKIGQEITDIRRTIHRTPEVGTCLPQTREFVMKKLREFGYEPKEICESGIVAAVTGNPEGKVLMLRADMDARPVKEEAPVEFRSVNGCMHACGHDMHTAMLLGAAKLLKEHEKELKGTVKLVFQPDEEGFTGAKSMLAAGVLENPRPDAALALHVHSGTPTGMVLCGMGTCMAGCTLFKIRVRGKGCHGAMPETGIDPINAAAHIYLALQELIAREVSPMKPAVVTIGKFSAGDAPNIIPGEAVLEGTIRSLDRELGEWIYQRICEISGSVASAFRAEAQVTQPASAPPLQNDPVLVQEMAGYAKELQGEKAVAVYQGGGMGSEDFSSYTYEIPSAYLLLGAGSAQEDSLYGKPMHNERVVFNEDILSMGAALHAYCAFSWLKRHDS